MTINTISLSAPVLGEEEKEALCATIDSGWLTMGQRVALFEQEFAQLHDVKSAVAVNSCTAGLHLCLTALNIGAKDEVLVPALTFVATVNAVLYAGAKPVFVDIQSPDLPHLSVSDAGDKLTEHTRAVIIMHYGGYAVDMAGWRSFADDNNLILIEDAAHAPGLPSVGRLSDASAFSFFSNKNMSTAEGGMILSKEEAFLERARRLRAHGMTSDTLSRHRGHAYSYDVCMLGYNYRMDEMRAAMGLVQLKYLQQWNQRRVQLSNFYRQMLADRMPQVVIPFNSNHETSAHLMPVLLPPEVNRQKIIDELREDGVQSSIHYPPVHRFSYYLKKFPGIKLKTTEIFCARELSLPLHPSMTEQEVSHVVRSLQSALGKANIEPKDDFACVEQAAR
jgi:dTDP-4-amino-4,6-dideoxygalactose transaminase